MDPDPTSQRPGWLPVAYVVLGAVLAFVVRPAELTSYEIGRSTGAVLIAILISYGIWTLVRRSRPSASKWSPWIFVMAIGIAIVWRIGPSDEAGRTDRPSAALPSPISTMEPSELFVEIEGFSYEEIPAATLDRLRDLYLSAPESARALLEVDGRYVFEGEQQVGVITAVFSEPAAVASVDFRAGVFDGFEASTEEQGGGPITPHEVEGIEARGGPTAQGYALTFITENVVVTVLGGDRATAELIAQGLVDDA